MSLGTGWFFGYPEFFKSFSEYPTENRYPDIDLSKPILTDPNRHFNWSKPIIGKLGVRKKILI